MNRRMSAFAVGAALVASAVLGAAPRAAAPTAQNAPAPAAAQVLRDIAGEPAFRAAFDGASAAPRLVLLLSPT